MGVGTAVFFFSLYYESNQVSVWGWGFWWTLYDFNRFGSIERLSVLPNKEMMKICKKLLEKKKSLKMIWSKSVICQFWCVWGGELFLESSKTAMVICNTLGILNAHCKCVFLHLLYTVHHAAHNTACWRTLTKESVTFRFACFSESYN